MQASPAQQNNLNLSSNVNKPNLKAQNNHIKPNSDLIKANASKGGYNKEMKPPSQPAPVKVAFRRLSPLFTETDFQNLLKMVHENMPNKIDRSIKLEYLYFSPGRISRKRGKIKSVGYVIVERRKGFTPTKVVEIISEAMASVYKDYITHERVDADSIRPLIELAPYQRIFRPKFRRDASEGTYEKDQEYKTFCTILETPIEKLPSADVQLDQKAQDATTEEKPVSALVTYLKERRMSSVRGKSRRGVGSDSRGRNSRSRGSIGNFPRGSRQGPMPSALNKKNLDMKDKKIIKPNSAESPKSKESEKIEMSSPKKKPDSFEPNRKQSNNHGYRGRGKSRDPRSSFPSHEREDVRGGGGERGFRGRGKARGRVGRGRGYPSSPKVHLQSREAPPPPFDAT